MVNPQPHGAQHPPADRLAPAGVWVAATLGSLLLTGASMVLTLFGTLSPMVLANCSTASETPPQCEYSDIWFPMLLLGPAVIAVAGMLAVWLRCQGRPRLIMLVAWAAALVMLTVLVNVLSGGQIF